MIELDLGLICFRLTEKNLFYETGLWSDCLRCFTSRVMVCAILLSLGRGSHVTAGSNLRGALEKYPSIGVAMSWALGQTAVVA